MKKGIKKRVLVMVGVFLFSGVAFADSWSNINQPVSRPENWIKLVETSPFSLGETKEITVENLALTEMSYGTYPSIDGSTVAVPMAMEFARQHLPLNDNDIEGFVSFSTTHGAYEHLIGRQANIASQLPFQKVIMSQNHPVDLMIGTPPSEDELALAKEQGVTLVKEPVCLDAFVFIVHKDNPVEKLTVEQVQKIYSGEIDSWAELGGEDLPIQAFQRERNSGSQTAMEEFVMKGVALKPEESFVVTTMGGLVEAIGTYQNNSQSIGYTYKYYIDTLYQNDDIKTIAVEGVPPTAQNLRNGSYPFITPYYGVIRQGEEEGTGGLFLTWMLSREGQKCIAQAGYTPVMNIEQTP
ncbi:MAG: solute-binding protein [Clostridiales bacterium]|nr:solute-binding protein [Clostridiales bacterium]